MSSPQIKVKRSAIAGKVPHFPSQIDLGEFAINTADGKVFIAAGTEGVGVGTTVIEVGISTGNVLTGIITAISINVTDLTVTNQISGISSGAAKVDTATDAGNQWHHVGFLDQRSGYQRVKTNGLTYNPSIGKLYAGIGSFGRVTGEVAAGQLTVAGIATVGNITLDSSNDTINAATVRTTKDGEGFRITTVGAIDNLGNDLHIFSTKNLLLEAGGGGSGVGTGLRILRSGNVTADNSVVIDECLSVVGVATIGNVVVGGATTDLIVNGDARVTGVLTVGESSVTLDGDSDVVQVGAALTLGHTQGVQFHTQNLHAEGFEVNNINASGVITSTNFVGNLTGDVTGNVTGSITGEVTTSGIITATSFHGNVFSTGISTISGFRFPSEDGTEDQALVTDGAGGLSFKTLSGGGGSVGGATTISTSNTTATEGQTAFTAPNVFDDGSQATAFSVQVFYNGAKVRVGSAASSDYTLSAPQTVNFASGASVGDEVDIVVYFGNTLEEEFFTATQDQTTFDLEGALAADENYKVYLNGAKLRKGVDYNATASVILTFPAQEGDEIDICSDQAEDQLTAAAGQTAFAPSNSKTTEDNMQVYLNGIRLRKTTDWTIGDPAITIINPVTGLDAGDQLDVVVRRS